MRLILVILITSLISLTACTKTKIKYVKSPPEIITQKEYINDNVSIPKFDNCSVYTDNITFQALNASKINNLDNKTIYYLDTYNALKLVNLETNRLNCIKKYRDYVETICSLEKIVCE